MSQTTSLQVTPTSEEIIFLPLGGAGEIGMNLTLYGHDGAWIIVDIGITFGGDDFPDYSVLMADPNFIRVRRKRLVGIVLTHAHEDHIGALPYLWQRLRCPVYATPFTAALARSKLARSGGSGDPVVEIPLGGRFQTGPFTVEYIGMTHSIPEPNGLLISTPVGSVFHTGDWKLDPNPVIGETYAERRLHALRYESLLAMVCDSTNATVPGHTGSEGELFKPLLEICQQASGRILVTGFASNIARLVTLARVAQKIGRRFGVIGPAMERMIATAKATGYWPEDLPPLLDGQFLGHLPKEEVFAACTGSQGEHNSALHKLARDGHRDMLLDPGDTVIFSSRMIPGNETSVERIHTQLRSRGVHVITDHEAHVHVSGHPAQEDLRKLYNWVQPPLVIPVHGTPRHLIANSEIALENHVPKTALVKNGDVCSLTPTGLLIIGEVETGRLSVGDDGRITKIPSHILEKMRACVH